jgi:hypothetical protein
MLVRALGRRVKRRGFAAQAAFRTAWRLSWIASLSPSLSLLIRSCTTRPAEYFL